MKAKEYFTEGKPLLTLERARELLPENKMSDEELKAVLLNIQQFCEMTYDIYLANQITIKEKQETEPDVEYRLAA